MTREPCGKSADRKARCPRHPVIPAEAGIQSLLDPRFRGGDDHGRRV